MKSKLISCLLFTTMLAAILIIPPKSRADSPDSSWRKGCIRITNISSYSSYRFVMYFDPLDPYTSAYQEFKNNGCVYIRKQSGYGKPTSSINIYAIKQTDFAKFTTILAGGDDPYTKRNKIGQFAPSSTESSGDSFYLDFDVTQPNLSGSDPYGITDPQLDDYQLNVQITSISSILNLDIVSRTYVYKNGTTKTVCVKPGCTSYPIPTPTPKPKATPTPAPVPKTTLSLTSQARLTSGKSQTITGTSSTIYPTDKLTLSGTTSANAKITLTIHSTPTTADITADASGNWTYTLDPKTLKLPLGSHTITAIATATNGAKSAEVTLATFTLKNPPTPVTVVDHWPWYHFMQNITNMILAAVAIFLIAVFIFLLVRRKRNNQVNLEKNV